MPVYAYRCGSCGVQFERQQGFHDAALKTCPECRKKTLVKVLAPVGIVFKGAGFYATDNRAGAIRTAGKEKKAEAKGDEPRPSGTASTVEKPAEKKDSSD
jgi:putative FmdB family regulatory protein